MRAQIGPKVGTSLFFQFNNPRPNETIHWIQFVTNDYAFEIGTQNNVPFIDSNGTLPTYDADGTADSTGFADTSSRFIRNDYIHWTANLFPVVIGGFIPQLVSFYPGIRWGWQTAAVPVTMSMDQSIINNTLTLTTTVSGDGLTPGALPTGTVTFFDTTTNTELGQASLQVVEGNPQAILAELDSTIATHDIVAKYLGDQNFREVTCDLSSDDGPLNILPHEQNVTVNTRLVLSTASHNSLSIQDIAVGATPVQVILTATHGTITLSSLTGLVLSNGTGTDNSMMSFIGTIFNINRALQGLIFNPTTNYVGAASVEIVTSELGIGTVPTDDDLLTIIVSDGPAIAVPGFQTTNENSDLIFSENCDNGLFVSAIGAGSNAIQVSLTAVNGVITLCTTTGLTFTEGTGYEDVTMTFSGIVNDINNALDGLIFSPTTDYTGEGCLMVLVDDLGNNASNSPLTASNSIDFTIYDTGPLNIVPISQSCAVNQVFVFANSLFNAISIQDIDAGSNLVQVELTATDGTLTLGSTTGLLLTSGSGTNDTTMTFTGTVEDINAALDGLTFTPASDYVGDTTLNIITNDLGNNPLSTPITDDDSVVVQVTDAPVNTTPTPQSIIANTDLILSAADDNAISVAAVNSGTSPIKITLTASLGTLTLYSTTGLTFFNGTGTDDTTMSFTGTVNDINSALNGLSFSPTTDLYGRASIEIVTDDLGNNTFNNPLAVTTVLDIEVLTNGPVNSVPYSLTTLTNNVLGLSVVNATALTIADVIADENEIEVSLTTTNGLLSLGATDGLTFTTGDGEEEDEMVFTGTVEDINAALEGSIFAPTADYFGVASITMLTDDLGLSESEANATAESTVAIWVSNAPLNKVPDVIQLAHTDTPLVFSEDNGNPISVADTLAGNDPVEVTLIATNGTLDLSSTSGLDITTGDGTGDAILVFSGTLDDLNAALEELTFNPTTDFYGDASIKMWTNDLGVNGEGGTLTVGDEIDIWVSLSPYHTAPGSQTTDEDTELVFSSGNENAIVLHAPGVDSDPVEMTLTATNGILSLSGADGLSFSVGDGTEDATMTFTGTIEDINAALEGLTFTPTEDYTGDATLEIFTDDLGNSGADGSLTAYDLVYLAIEPVNDAPVITVPSTQATNASTGLVFSTGNGNAISIADVDAGSAVIQITLTADLGTLSLSTTTGLSFSFSDGNGTGAGDGADDETMTFRGTITAINNALNGLTFTPSGSYPGNASVTIGTNDLGNSGSGGALTDEQAVDIVDPPVITKPGTQMTYKNTALVFSTTNIIIYNAISIADPDLGSNELEVTLSVSHGVLSLSGTSGISFTTGDGTNDVTMTFTGTLSAINAALNGLTFTPDTDYTGSASLDILVDDQGNSGCGYSLTDEESVSIFVMNNQ